MWKVQACKGEQDTAHMDWMEYPVNKSITFATVKLTECNSILSLRLTLLSKSVWTPRKKTQINSLTHQRKPSKLHFMPIKTASLLQIVIQYQWKDGAVRQPWPKIIKIPPQQPYQTWYEKIWEQMCGLPSETSKTQPTANPASAQRSQCVVFPHRRETRTRQSSDY